MIKKIAILFSCLSLTLNVMADELTAAYELIHDEQEVGTDVYRLRTTITNRYLRMDDLSDERGYIVYDHDQSTS